MLFKICQLFANILLANATAERSSPVGQAKEMYLQDFVGCPAITIISEANALQIPINNAINKYSPTSLKIARRCPEETIVFQQLPLSGKGRRSNYLPMYHHDHSQVTLLFLWAELRQRNQVGHT